MEEAGERLLPLDHIRAEISPADSSCVQRPHADFDSIGCEELQQIRTRIKFTIARALGESAKLGEVQHAVEARAANGLDGPRPCMFLTTEGATQAAATRGAAALRRESGTRAGAWQTTKG